MRYVKKVIACLIVVGVLCLGHWWDIKKNPYSTGTWVTPFFVAETTADGSVALTKARDVHVTSLPLASLVLYFQIVEESIFRLLPFAYHDIDTTISGSENDIIAALHAERFDPSRAYVITGGHFPDVYTRNLGIFFSGILDPRIPSSEENWRNREMTTMQTLATHLELLKQAGKEYTTFAPVAPNTFAAVNWNDEPSDSLFAIMYTLRAASDDTFISDHLPTQAKQTRKLGTKKAAQELLQNYKPVIEKEIARYSTLVMDQHTGLVKTDVALSGARDNMRETSGLYDNMIAWATAKNAEELGLHFPCPETYRPVVTKDPACNFVAWKQNIVTAFWRDEQTGGLFINDQSATSLSEHTYTGEEFLALQIGFLDIHDASDREKLFKMVSYVKAQKLDKPFPLLYATSDDRSKASNFFMGLTSYAGRSMWSHLGQAYIQSLIMLSPEHPELKADAKKYLDTYKTNIEKYGGYPELYNADGTLFTAPISKAVLHVGWVINYEQTRMLFKNVAR